MKDEIEIPSDGVMLRGILSLPEKPKGLVIFAHGSGSSRLSPRNTFVAKVLQQDGFGTFLMDLLTPDEAENRENVFDIPFLAERLHSAATWSQKAERTKGLPLGYFGASTGAGAALEANAEFDEDIFAIVSRGGRPDLAMEYLSRVKSPTLLIVGGNDEEVIRMNEAALEDIAAEKKLVIVPGATHLFEEPGTLEEVARLAAEWFTRHA